MNDESWAGCLREIAVQCDEAIGDTGTAAVAALASASAALRLAAQVAPGWEPGITSPRIVADATPIRVGAAATTAREYGRMSVSSEMYDLVKAVARKWAGCTAGSRRRAARNAPGIGQDLDRLARAMGYHLNEESEPRDDGTTEARAARRAPAAHVIERAWAAANLQQRAQIGGASPPLVHALKMLEANPADEPAVDSANTDDDGTTIDKAV